MCVPSASPLPKQTAVVATSHWKYSQIPWRLDSLHAWFFTSFSSSTERRGFCEQARVGGGNHPPMAFNGTSVDDLQSSSLSLPLLSLAHSIPLDVLFPLFYLCCYQLDESRGYVCNRLTHDDDTCVVGKERHPSSSHRHTQKKSMQPLCFKDVMRLSNQSVRKRTKIITGTIVS